MEKISAIAVDDEPIALKVIKDHAAKIPILDLRSTFVSTLQALAYLQDNPTDLIFLDIHMPDLSGIELAQILPRDMKVIFTTAYSKYAVKGFEVAAIDYLLKPISFKRFLNACTRVQNRLGEKTDVKEIEKYLFVKDGYDFVRIDLSKLLYVQSDNNYVTFRENSKQVVARMTLTDTFEKLPEDKFVRVHKSFVVAINKIEKVERHQLIIQNKRIPISGTYKNNLLNRLNKT